MNFNDLATYLWLALGVLVLGSIYLIVEGYKVHKLFAESIVGKLVKALVVVFLIELYSLGVVSFAFMFFYSQGAVVLFPIVLLWIVSLGFAVFAIRSAKQEVTGLMKK
ncbi:MAG: hypothetical protein AAB729_03390 [Patescibacteria group bacterium]